MKVDFTLFVTKNNLVHYELSTYYDLLCYSCREGLDNVVVLLLDLTLDKYTWSRGFEIACINNNINIAKLIYEKKDITVIKNNIFKWACYHGSFDSVKWLFENFNINTTSSQNFSFKWSCYFGYLEQAKYIYNVTPNLNIHCDGDYPLRSACQNGKLETVKWLLSLDDFNLNVYNGYCFRYACRNGHRDIVMLLMNYNLELTLIDLNFCFRNACRNGDIEIAKILLNMNKDINIKSYNNYALKYSYMEGHYEITEWLINMHEKDIDYNFINMVSSFDSNFFKLSYLYNDFTEKQNNIINYNVSRMYGVPVYYVCRIRDKIRKSVDLLSKWFLRIYWKPGGIKYNHIKDCIFNK